MRESEPEEAAENAIALAVRSRAAALRARRGGREHHPGLAANHRHRKRRTPATSVCRRLGNVCPIGYHLTAAVGSGMPAPRAFAGSDDVVGGIGGKSAFSNARRRP
jgi:hypothetical protein